MDLYLNENVDTVECLKKRLDAYKSLNSDLTKKCQDLKLELTATRTELQNAKKQLLEEQRKSTEYKNSLNIINSQCFQFCNSYFTLVNQINEENPDITLNFPRSGQCSTNATPDLPQQPKKFVKPRRHSLPNDAEMLGAITEESSMTTSTPFHYNPVRKLKSNSLIKPFESMSSSVDESTIHDTPKKANISRSRRLSERLSSNEEEKSPEQLNLLLQTEQMKECTVNITILEAERINEEQQKDSGINEEDCTPPKRNDETTNEKIEEISKEQTSEEQEKTLKKAAPKKGKLKERQNDKVEQFKVPKVKNVKKNGKENDDDDKNLKRKKTNSESSDDGSIDEGAGRAKRYKRKEGTYKEPSLNTKMRRPKEK